MDWLIELSDYIIGSLLFFTVFYLGTKFLNKILLDIATNKISDIVENFKKNKLPLKNAEDEIKHEKNRKKEIEKKQNVYKDQIDLEVLEKAFEINSKPQKKIVGVSIKDMIKGKWTQMIAAKQVQILQQLNMETLQSKGINQAMFEARNGSARNSIANKRNEGRGM